jgi:hypothetical protein
MKKSLIMFLAGLALVCMTSGLVTLNSNTVGVSVSQSEANSVAGGTCYVEDANASAKVVCNFLSGCGNLTIRPNVEYASGKSSASIPCSTGASCTYTGVSAASCSGG